MSSTSGKVQCPICAQWVAAQKINAHIDANCPPPTTAATAAPTLPTSPDNKVKKEGKSPARQQQQLFNRAGSLEKLVKSSSFSVNTPSSPPIPTKMAPLFAPKQPPPSQQQPQPQSQDRYINEKSFSISGQQSNSSQKRTMQEEPTSTAQPTTSNKRKKIDAAIEAMPLAARVRPNSLTDFVGQEELLGPDGILKKLIDNDRIPSCMLWGPPGCGKTTIARIISKLSESRFVELSATTHGAADVRKAFDEARGHLSLTGQKTIVFIDEIHRFTKAQQDLFLPYVEHGTIHLIGATTENPSFKVNSALLSRCKVFVLKRLDQDQIEQILKRALQKWRGLVQDWDEEVDGVPDTTRDNDALKQLAVYSDGDARTALNTLEIAISLLPSKQSPLEVETVKGAFQKSHLLYDRNGDQHYDIISALHKSIRGSDADAALYWLGRMLEAGEDPLYVARRLVRCASEDIGLADNTALPLAMAAYHACEKIGMPECDTILAHLVVHLAETKKSVRSYKAYNLVKQTIRQKPAYPVPMHIRNAPTRLMKDLGYGQGYKYNPDYDEPVDQTYLPDELKDERFLDKK